MTDHNLKGKVAIVTGAGSVTERRTSMGPVMAKALHDAGASVAGIDVNEDGLKRLEAMLNPAGGSKRFLRAISPRWSSARPRSPK
jgi:NAD(P)-dependent dehydrogenase (short-subunit alcohol dehydrogenase family)